MRLLLSLLYLFLYAFLGAGAVLDDISREYPPWFTGLDLAFRVSAFVCILLYIIGWRPEPLRPLWRLFPVALVLFDVFCWYYDIFVSPDLKGTVAMYIAVTIIGVVALCPSWYMCFRYGYRKRIKERPYGDAVQDCSE